MTERRRAAVNVDVDGLYLYDRIHGHSGSSGNAADFDPAQADPMVWTRGVTRFLDLFDRVGIRATFFVVAQDLAHADVRAVLKECVVAGHEIGNHSATHPYDLSRRTAPEMAAEVGDARKRLEDFCATPVTGFRAPGYVTSAALLDAVVASGHVYDSSRFPCPSYQAAKAAFIAWYRLRGRPSGSLAEGPGVWLGPTEPYVERTASGRALLELPVGVLPVLRLPFIGTSVIAMGRAGQLATAPLQARADWLNFELHAIDLLDHQGDGLPARLLAQPDQRVPLAHKWPLLLRTLEAMIGSHEVRTLAGWTSAWFAAEDGPSA